MVKYILFRPTVKYEIIPYTSKLLKKKNLLFFSPSIRMSEKNVNFGDKNIKKSNFYKKQKSNKDRRN